MTRIVCVHGWGFDQSFWEPLKQELIGFDLDCLDLGFRGSPVSVPSNEPVIGIGHSFGVLWLLHQSDIPLKALVSLNGFTGFCKSDEMPNGTDNRVLDRMIRALRRSPEPVLADFFKNSGLDRMPQDIAWDLAKLIWGLEGLRHWQVTSDIPVLALAGGQDVISSPDHQRGCFGSYVRFLEDGDHLLPLKHPKWVAGQMAGFLKEHA